jgi:hypothetical protein
VFDVRFFGVIFYLFAGNFKVLGYVVEISCSDVHYVHFIIVHDVHWLVYTLN